MVPPPPHHHELIGLMCISGIVHSGLEIVLGVWAVDALTFCVTGHTTGKGEDEESGDRFRL